jgi:hypothetical protein
MALVASVAISGPPLAVGIAPGAEVRVKASSEIGPGMSVLAVAMTGLAEGAAVVGVVLVAGAGAVVFSMGRRRCAGWLSIGSPSRAVLVAADVWMTASGSIGAALLINAARGD